MSNVNNNSTPGITNPIQTNNTLTAIVAYVAGILVVKFPIFDLATWSTILTGVGGAVLAAYAAYTNRKTAVVAKVANLPEVKNVELDKTVQGTGAIAAATPDNVVLK